MHVVVNRVYAQDEADSVDEVEQIGDETFGASASTSAESPRAPSVGDGDASMPVGDQAEQAGDAPILTIPFADSDEAEEGWEGFDELDLPAQGTPAAESAQEEPDSAGDSAQVLCYACCGSMLCILFVSPFCFMKMSFPALHCRWYAES